MDQSIWWRQRTHLNSSGTGWPQITKRTRKSRPSSVFNLQTRWPRIGTRSPSCPSRRTWRYSCRCLPRSWLWLKLSSTTHWLMKDSARSWTKEVRWCVRRAQVIMPIVWSTTQALTSRSGYSTTSQSQLRIRRSVTLQFCNSTEVASSWETRARTRITLEGGLSTLASL